MNTSTSPIFNAVEDSLAHVVQSDQIRSASHLLIVAVSGGADSVCLLHALAQLASRWRLNLHVAHLDHSLRPDPANSSVGDAAHVARLAVALGLPFHMARLPVGALTGGGSVENAARQARYAFLSTLAARLTPQGQRPVVCVAHHANDQAETVLMNLVRGSGLRGLGGMQPLADCPVDNSGRGVQILRPLLAIERSEIEAYLRAHDLTWREDRTNRDEALVRNRLRHSVLPMLESINPSVVQTLVRTAGLLASESTRLEEYDRAKLASLRLGGDPRGIKSDTKASKPSERVVLNWSALWPQGDAALRSVLRIAMFDVAGSDHELPFALVDDLVQQLRRVGEEPAASGPHPLGGGVAWSVAGGQTHSTDPQPARLSIHQQDALPFPPDHPHLGRAWRTRMGAAGAPVLVGEPVVLESGWTLHGQLLHVEELPSGWKQRHDPWVAHLDAEHAELLRLVVPRAGMRFAPLGLGGRHKSLGDLLTDRKIPVSLRTGWPLIVAGSDGRILWVCGIQMGHPARVTPQTQRVVRLYWKNG